MGGKLISQIFINPHISPNTVKMSYKIENRKLFAKVTQNSPIWSEPHDMWMEIGLADLPEEVAGIIDFKPIPSDCVLPEEKKDFKISVIMPRIAPQAEGKKAPDATLEMKAGAIVKSSNGEIYQYIGNGKTVNGVGFTLYETEPSEIRKDYCYIMEMSTGKKYVASKSTIDSMIDLFKRLHSVKECTTIDDLKNRMLRATDNTVPIKNIQYFRTFFYLLVNRGLVKLESIEGKKNRFRIIICKY